MYIRSHIIRHRTWSRLIRYHATLVTPISSNVAHQRPIATRPIVDQETMPKLRIRPFSRKGEEDNVDFTKLPLDTYPNPLYSMTTKSILGLSQEEFRHLLKIPYRHVGELDQFFVKITQIVKSLILQNPPIVVNLIENLRHSDIFENMQSALLEVFEKDRVRLSILLFILSPGSPQFLQSFFLILADIMNTKEKSFQEKSVLLVKYFDLFARSDIINESPILLDLKFYSKIMKTFGPAKFNQLFSYFVNLNIQTRDLLLIKSLKKTLENGSEVDRFTARTGWINPDWRHILKASIPENQRQKMVAFYSIDDFQRFADIAIKKHDIILANLYVSLLVKKFEIKSNKKSSFINDSSISDDIQTLLEVILNHVMEFKGSKHATSVLKYMKDNQLQIRFNTLLILMRQLRLKSHYQDALLIMNNINMNQISDLERKQLVHEILLLIKKRYPKSPKILIGYCASIFNNTECDGLELLNDLGILGITHGLGQVGSVSNLETIQKANLDSGLSGFKFTHTALSNVYETILGTTPRSFSSDYIPKLYDLYISQVEANRFVDMNDRVINKFINFLLRKLAGGRINFKFHRSLERYDIAKRIFLDFHDKTPLKRRQTTTSLFDLLIHVSLTYHQDYEFASKVIKLAREMSVTPTFNQIYPFIIFHYNREEYTIAELWYKELVKHGVVTKVLPSKKLFSIARELNWDVNGFVNRSLHIRRNYKTTEELARVANEPVMFIDTVDPEEEVTEELITDSMESADVNFSDELSAVLYGATN